MRAIFCNYCKFMRFLNNYKPILCSKSIANCSGVRSPLLFNIIFARALVCALCTACSLGAMRALSYSLVCEAILRSTCSRLALSRAMVRAILISIGAVISTIVSHNSARPLSQRIAHSTKQFLYFFIALCFTSKHTAGCSTLFRLSSKSLSANTC